MAYLRKLKSGKWQVLIRKANQPHVIKSFLDKGTASKFARETETLMDKGIFEDYHCARSTTIGDLLIKYKEKSINSFVKLLIVSFKNKKSLSLSYSVFHCIFSKNNMFY